MFIIRTFRQVRQNCEGQAVEDNITRLYYLNARYYDSSMGRFISQDSYRGELND